MHAFKPLIVATLLVASAVYPAAVSAMPCCCKTPAVAAQKACCSTLVVPHACCAKKATQSASVQFRSSCCCVESSPVSTPLKQDQSNNEQEPSQIAFGDCVTARVLAAAGDAHPPACEPSAKPVRSGSALLAFYCLWLK